VHVIRFMQNYFLLCILLSRHEDEKLQVFSILKLGGVEWSYRSPGRFSTGMSVLSNGQESRRTPVCSEHGDKIPMPLPGLEHRAFTP
jgi:hypothetical protein